ncbi:hypothetical protein GJ700_02585 [Duganella sp. FT92W]|uniref:Uncharacterized protein n=1 Tax=Pseudoduganella rivuli TaxID=2666085 RepID=A0A7X2LQX4_9BURK|nr:hypothetical protein [Pseudoduganella rivuli]MRV70606.1 hypothetical protein [Pseudoduganella rivuli]
MNRHRHNIMELPPGAHTPLAQAISHLITQLGRLPPGCRLCAHDGTEYIRTNLICYGFCDLHTGVLCSARDICFRHGGVDAVDTSVASPVQPKPALTGTLRREKNHGTD